MLSEEKIIIKVSNPDSLPKGFCVNCKGTIGQYRISGSLLFEWGRDEQDRKCMIGIMTIYFIDAFVKNNNIPARLETLLQLPLGITIKFEPYITDVIKKLLIAYEVEESLIEKLKNKKYGELK